MFVYGIFDLVSKFKHQLRYKLCDYSPFVIRNNIGGSNVICSGSIDNTIRFWDIRSNKNKLYIIKLNERAFCLKFRELKKKANSNEQKLNGTCTMFFEVVQHYSNFKDKISMDQ
ncbi:hypothetical protein RFI_26190 [Reticulomyxa filosa]|uniref:WD-40 repeat protein n=1 Tax=Reticulomyxa filosa TaxID=46433 RepID=X6MBY0_RETFI|nr:hypothetical protein RFI_26190 [Reticulomyxa filosa]|eukprot:ETO11186.1 hypothetical protein RFI_26190 [Reticulomyxa filosa]